MLTIVDYGVGNLASIQNMLKRIGIESNISSSEDSVLLAEKLILPGVGAFDTCASKLKDSGLLLALNKVVNEDKVPILGICVGMQMMLESSEEGLLSGLGWIKGKVMRFKSSEMSKNLKIPHMGWTEVRLNKESRLFEKMHDEPRFYFVHSYHATTKDERDVLAYAYYGDKFVAAIEHDNVLGVQFHPEKSHKFGMRLFENFVNLY
jgi:glutamine amidotransferase